MNTSVVREFLLFDLTQWVKYGNVIISFCEAAIFPIFIFSLLYDKIAVNQAPVQILKRAIIAQLILILLPTYYQKVAGFGFDVADSVMKEQRNGLIVNWVNIKRKAERASKQENKPVDALTSVTNIFNFNANDIVEKSAGFIIYLCILLIKVIFSVVYYGTYSIIAIWAALAIMPSFEKNFLSIFKSVLYIILTPILISLALAFINESLNFAISADGFLETMTEMSKFLVLCFVLLGTLVISYSVINGAGIESWAAKMAGLTGASLPHAALSGIVNHGLVNPIKKTGSKGAEMLASRGNRLTSDITKTLKSPFQSKVPNSKMHDGKFAYEKNNKKSPASIRKENERSTKTKEDRDISKRTSTSMNASYSGHESKNNYRNSSIDSNPKSCLASMNVPPKGINRKTNSRYIAPSSERNLSNGGRQMEYSKSPQRSQAKRSEHYANRHKINNQKADNKKFGGVSRKDRRSSMKQKTFISDRRSKK